ncbi:acetyl-CoA carboxylase biotin carboxylase subunit [Banduia mediterranea]|uniref:acetyl-CoA carboxylase biotin carboxylase subunit n=1 Tax=Banduia mediterranea TaxID=3075609 RepID=UPI0032C24AEF
MSTTSALKPIRRLLVANRGEIAARILRTARARGITTAIVRHPAEEGGTAPRLADDCLPIEGPTPVVAYLNVAEIVRAAREWGADAVHPGYGFLSENAALARGLAEAGIRFVGPTAEAIELMGDKIRARNFVVERGFPVAPSAVEADDPATFAKRALAVDLPILIKPAAGGGGKGMRIVREAATLEAELATARREGERYFGDGRLFVERYVERPRHIEVQVFGDIHGNVVHFGERECSVQRRFQKIVEETPSPVLNPEKRKSICEAAVGIAKAAGYVGAGTVEFIYGADGEFYFLEMNTRLQVEHPVTEMVTGFDLVAEQLRVAEGAALGYAQADIVHRGHSIELRICAEDPAAGFVPATGRIHLLREATGPGVRVDSGVHEGQTVGTDFDPLLSKLIVHGRDRAEAIARARQALRDTVLLGLTTNIAYLDRILAHPRFASGDYTTAFLEQEAAALSGKDETVPTDILLAAAALSDRQMLDAAASVPAIYAAMGPWRN